MLKLYNFLQKKEIIYFKNFTCKEISYYIIKKADFVLTSKGKRKSFFSLNNKLIYLVVCTKYCESDHRSLL